MASLLPWFGRRNRRHIRVTRGRDIAIGGAPGPEIGEAPEITRLGFLYGDVPGLRARPLVAAGDAVAAGDPLFADRRRPEVLFTAPAAGRVTRVVGREAPAAEQGVEIELSRKRSKTFERPSGTPGRAAVKTLLLESGLWPALRARPFGGIADPQTVPDALFITAIDTEPLAADPRTVIVAHDEAFRAGVDILRGLTDGPVFVCQGPGLDLADGAVIFEGPHPAGLPGTHIHHLLPVGGGRRVWHIGYQDVIAVGYLFENGRLWPERVVSLAGPGVRAPRLIRVPPGADLGELTAGQLADADMRVISGSVLSGRKQPYLGRYHLQVSVLAEAWDAPATPFPPSAVSTALHGRAGPVIPVAELDRIMGPDIPAVPLIRALAVGDRDAAERLGCRELMEEDLALLSYFCPGKNNYGPMLRAILDEMEGDG